MGKEWNDFLDAKALDEEMLQQISGGATGRARWDDESNGSSPTRIACCKCHRFFPVDISKDGCKCPYCGEPNKFDG